MSLYEHPTGREAVLEMIHAIIMKFPPQVVNEQSQTLFVQLVVCLANDSEKKVRSMTGAAIKLLISRVSPQSLHSISEYALFWYSGEKQGLWSAAAQVLGLLLEVMKKGFTKHIDAIFTVMRRILQSAVNVLKNDHTDPPSGTVIPLWKEAYYSLVLFEKILLQFPEMCLSKDLEVKLYYPSQDILLILLLSDHLFGSRNDIWEIVCEFLLHPHIWVRNISNRLIALYFATVTEGCKQNDERWVRELFLMRPSRLFLLAVSFCSQLKASLTDDSANNYLKQNIVFSILGLHSMIGRQKEPKDEEIFIKAFLILDSRKGRNMFASFADDLDVRNETEDCERCRYFLISALLKRMGKIALDMEEVQMRIVFDSFRLVSPKILDSNESSEEFEKKDGQNLAYQVLLPLYKICEGFAGKVVSDDGKQFAQEVRDSIRDAIGVQNFVQVYSSVRKNLKTKRDKRRQGEKVMAVVNP
ncbi:hypothetical protein OSB04_010270 [Centaurea solstitialis]|uniref:Uncharacterized protein n=1 Tax=Centaurea solstitialis TaxID=347529 RepID=A0AA38TI19_9ASTR|nr:hypothetical protein OSB04_010270 [Centaurea solstitialis]